MDSSEGRISPFHDFIEQLMKEKGLAEVDPEVKSQLSTDLDDRLERLINAEIVKSLSQEDLASFEKMLDDNASEEEIQGFLKSHIDNFDNLIAQVLLDFRKIYLG